MVKFYVNKIKRGEMTLDQVPAKWRDQVAAELGIEIPEAPIAEPAEDAPVNDAQAEADAADDVVENTTEDADANDDDGAAD